MISLPDRKAMLLALAMPLPAVIKAIIRKIANDPEISDYTYVAVIDAADSEQAIIDEIGWSPLVHPINGNRHWHPDFEPYCAYLNRHPGWFELCHIVGNCGFAYVLLIEDAGDGDLQAMCRRYV